MRPRTTFPGPSPRLLKGAHRPSCTTTTGGRWLKIPAAAVTTPDTRSHSRCRSRGRSRERRPSMRGPPPCLKGPPFRDGIRWKPEVDATDKLEFAGPGRLPSWGVPPMLAFAGDDRLPTMHSPDLEQREASGGSPRSHTPPKTPAHGSSSVPSASQPVPITEFSEITEEASYTALNPSPGQVSSLDAGC